MPLEGLGDAPLQVRVDRLAAHDVGLVAEEDVEVVLGPGLRSSSSQSSKDAKYSMRTPYAIVSELWQTCVYDSPPKMRLSTQTGSSSS